MVVGRGYVYLIRTSVGGDCIVEDIDRVICVVNQRRFEAFVGISWVAGWLDGRRAME